MTAFKQKFFFVFPIGFSVNFNIDYGKMRMYWAFISQDKLVKEKI
ncbi:hypothetical protein LCGT_1329 [Lactococcus garvieae ATCC 49156]|uniref:Uncharacterized protein n=1 Tax=Lactococcus garvieae (strain Lg2) TaxID=420890 RepID=F9VEQ9_LACGL|nr:hypothetical protein LCGT_1329 [Lactococcus garvieae ATCC 49156]BAK60810.1 hypothetical protein LCGL_1350 [Lactococcus garvieae Lg2]